jgi:DNA polymerase-3 subunit alpha
MPDIDTDFCYERSDEVIEYVKQKYGAEHVAQIVTFGTMAARAAVRDVGRVLEIPYAEVDAVSKMISPQLSLRESLEENKDLFRLYETNDVVKELIDTSMSVEGMPRHASTHAAGVVITQNPLQNDIPLAVNGGMVVTQYAKDAIEELGFLKFDFLALRYLTIINDTVKLIKKKDPSFDIEALSFDEAAVYKLLSSGKTNGVFQLESSGIKQVLTQLQPNCFDDIIACIALYRPGPMDSIPDYIERRHNPSKIKYKSSLLESILKKLEILYLIVCTILCLNAYKN